MFKRAGYWDLEHRCLRVEQPSIYIPGSTRINANPSIFQSMQVGVFVPRSIETTNSPGGSRSCPSNPTGGAEWCISHFAALLELVNEMTIPSGVGSTVAVSVGR
jgi:hypothetical protein